MRNNSNLITTILITGKDSRFCRYLKNELNSFKTIFTSKENFNLSNFDQMKNFLKCKKISHIIHIAGLSRPTNIHEKKMNLSIDLNIIGTANIVKLCNIFNIKLIYFSTHYVYPCNKGNYSESDPLLPINKYAWSKLGGESSVHLCKKYLILRLSMTEYPFTHKKAIRGAKSNFIFNKEAAKIIPYVLNENGTLNIGGKKRDIFDFARNFGNKNISPINWKKVKNFPEDSSTNISRLKNILKKKKIQNKIIL